MKRFDLFFKMMTLAVMLRIVYRVKVNQFTGYYDNASRDYGGLNQDGSNKGGEVVTEFLV